MTKAGVRTGSQPIVAVIEPGVIRKERFVLPLWVTLLGITLRALTRLAVTLVLAGVRFWPLTLITAAAAYLWRVRGVQGLVTAGLLVAVLGWAVLAWFRLLAPTVFGRLVGEPVRGHWRWHRVYRRRWREAMSGCGLIVRHEDVEYLPQVDWIRSNGVVDTLRLRLAAGQTPQDLLDAAEGLRHLYGALRCSVRDDGPGWVLARFYVRDPLTAAVTPPPLPTQPDPPSNRGSGIENAGPAMTGGQALDVLRSLRLGRVEDGTDYVLNLVATHVLVAGSTGAGKGSVLWSLVRLLTPLVRAGLVQLWVVDPKGGMEFRAGRPLFARYEDSSHEAMIGLLEDAADAMDERTNRLAGHVRSHTPTTEDPFVVVLVDEVADLTAHAPDTATKKRAASALSRLLAKGRAPGFAVVAAVIDPRKDVIPFRDLFPTRIAMRLAEPEQTDLVLGDGARDRGADCSAIPRSLPGVAYVHDDTSTDPAPIRVRFSHVTDDHIAALVHAHLMGSVADTGNDDHDSDERRAA
jgi:DNA segregation ATPase FtsK/SpoIIIE, S-DNA-T family